LQRIWNHEGLKDKECEPVKSIISTQWFHAMRPFSKRDRVCESELASQVRMEVITRFLQVLEEWGYAPKKKRGACPPELPSLV
jgi:hypothetical protein